MIEDWTEDTIKSLDEERTVRAQAKSIAKVSTGLHDLLQRPAVEEKEEKAKQRSWQQKIVTTTSYAQIETC